MSKTVSKKCDVCEKVMGEEDSCNEWNWKSYTQRLGEVDLMLSVSVRASNPEHDICDECAIDVMLEQIKESFD